LTGSKFYIFWDVGLKIPVCLFAQNYSAKKWLLSYLTSNRSDVFSELFKIHKKQPSKKFLKIHKI